MDTCAICLCDLETESAYRPTLGCSCKYFLHKECWNKWNGTCIYCRKTVPGYPIIILAEYIYYRRLEQEQLIKKVIELLIAILIYYMYT